MIFLLNSLIREVYERGYMKKYLPPRPALSFGNVRLGGTGKTPHVIYSAIYLHKRGVNLCVLTRGYGRKGKDLLLFPPGVKPGSTDSVGDEAMLIKRKVPDILLCISPDRRAGMERVIRDFDVDLFLLDDGFQQFQMRKSLDMVLLRYDDLPGIGNLTNHFAMRESPRSLKYADFIVVTKVPDLVDPDLVDSVGGRYFRHVDRAFSRYRISGMGSNRGEETGDWGEKEFFLFGGVGDFSGVLDTARSHGITISGHSRFPDHTDYTAEKIARVREKARGRPLLTTEKDLVKLPHEKFGEIFSLSIEVEFLVGKELFEKKIKSVAGLE